MLNDRNTPINLELCYTVSIGPETIVTQADEFSRPSGAQPATPELEILQTWARGLFRLGLSDWVASFLEAAGGLSVLGAQAIYLSQPLLSLAISQKQLAVLASLLEEPARARSFAALLREGNIS